VGWILDLYIQGEKADIWLRTEKGKVLKLIDPYFPKFYLLPKSEDHGKTLYQLLQDSTNVRDIDFEEKHIMLNEERKMKLLRVTVDNVRNYKRLLTKVKPLPQVKALYNTDLLHVQQYVSTKLKVAPTSKVEIQYNNEQRLHSIHLIDDSEEIPPPPFTILLFDIQTNPSVWSPHPHHDPIIGLEVKYEDEEHALQGDEPDILNDFSSKVRAYDPDFLVCPDPDNTISYLFERIRRLQLDIQLGRENVDLPRLSQPLPYWFHGRVVLDFGYFNTFGIVGLVERSRFGMLPPCLASKWTANKTIESKNCYELLQRGYAIPKKEGYYEYVRTLKEVADRDRGSLILTPKIGVVHENVAELDFESQYPNLIVNGGLSYETVTPSGVIQQGDGLLPSVTKHFLKRRLWFKRLRKKFVCGSQEWRWCEQRQLALKMILVCLYGTSGCCWNRFGNVLCFEEINRRSRQTLVKTKDIVLKRGFDVVYADTDSIFVKKEGTTKREYEKLATRISQRVDLPIALDHHYKFLLLLPLEADPSGQMEAQKRYFGLLMNGELLARGIEIRRHDCPRFIKAFQIQLIKTLLDVETAEDVGQMGYRKALSYVSKTIDKLIDKKVPIDELVISKVLRKSLSEYKLMPPHVSAAINLAHVGKTVKKGDLIEFVVVNARHHVPLRRVAPFEIYNSSFYDCQKYREMVLDAAETVLSTFGFSKEKYGLPTQTRLFHRA
jgi:DNA polymerase elongation subunit (family B)